MNDLLSDVKAGTSTADNPFAAPPASSAASAGGAGAGAGGRRHTGGSGTTKNPAYKGMEGDIEMGDLTGASDQEVAMKNFFAAVEVIKGDIAEIKRWQDVLRDEHERSKALIKSKDVQQSRQTMQETINRVSALANKVKGEVQRLEKDNEASAQLPGRGKNSASERMRTSITAGLKRKLKDEMDGFSVLRSRIQDEYRDVVTKRVYTVTGQMVSEDDVDRLIESGEAENIFQKAVVHDQAGRTRVLDTLAEVQERHNAVKALEQSLLELHQIFLDMALLVEAQGEALNNIEEQVKRSADAVGKGTDMVQQAKRLKDKTRRLWCWGTIIVLIIIIIIVIFSVQPWKYVPKNR